MDFIDYREKLGIEFCDEEKFKYFLQKIYNILEEIGDNVYSGGITDGEYYSFCNLTGSYYDRRYSADYHRSERFKKCLSILDKHQENIRDFLAYYVALTNSIEIEKPSKEELAREDFKNILINMLAESHIQFDLVKTDGEYFVFPKGVPELDNALVSQPLEWLNEYPSARRAWVKALKEYANATEDTASDVADKFRKALEAFFQEFFGGGKSLENYKAKYGSYLKGQGVPKEISGNFETLLQSYTQFMNSYAKHRDATSDKVLEYIMYQTGNIIRLLITLKQTE